PPAQALAKVTPNSIGVDYIDTSFYLTVTNNGISGNNIRMIRITPPGFITNISMITSSLISANVKYTNSAILVLYYQFSTNLKVGKKDVIRFTGYDNATNAMSGSFIVEAGSTTNMSGLTNVGLLFPDSLNIGIYQPTYAAESYITPSVIDTTSSTNSFVFYIKNTGSVGNDITYLDIYFPPYFITNGLSVTSIKAGSYTKYTDRIRLDYTTGTNIGFLKMDTITMIVADTFSQGFTNVHWYGKARYTTSGANYIDVSVPHVSGQTDVTAFCMPSPKACISLLPDEIYSTSRTNLVRYNVRNEGRGSNKILQLRITLPAVFTQGLEKPDIQSTLADETNYDNGSVVLKYLSFIAGNTDVIMFRIVNSETNLLSYPFSAVASNYGSSTNAYGSYSLKIVSPPSCSLSPNIAESTVASNRLSFYIKQDGTAVSEIKRCVLTVSSFYTNIKNINSSRATNNNNNKSSVTLYYKNFTSGLFDTVQFTAFDTLESGFTNLTWSHALIDNGTGLVPSRRTPGLSLNVYYSNPPAAALCYVVAKSNNKFYVNDVTNSFKVFIENTGTAQNSIYQAIIHIPPVFTNYQAISSSHIFDEGTQIKMGPSSITLSYAGDTSGLLKPGETDEVWILGYDRVTYNTDVYIGISVDNHDGRGSASAGTKPGKSTKVSFIFEPNSILAYIYSQPAKLYTIYTNFSMNFDGTPLKYKIENLSYSSQIRWLKIDFKLSAFTDVTGYSFFTNKLFFNSKLLTNEKNAIILTPTNIIIDYTAEDTNIGPFNNDIIEINGYYIVTNAKTMFLQAKACYHAGGIEQDTYIPQGETKTLEIEKPEWGVVFGRVFPSELNVSINLYPVGSGAAARSVTYTTREGVEYKIDKVPEGVYHFSFSSSDYLTDSYGIENITIQRNNVQIDLVNKKLVYQHVNDVLLKNKVLNSKELSQQVRKCKSRDDSGRTQFIVPEGTLFDSFFLEIFKQAITEIQISAFSRNKIIKTIEAPQNIPVYLFDIEDLTQTDLSYIKFKAECEMVLYYDRELISSLGWKEEDLAAAYWDEASRDWVLLGGDVDKVTSTVHVQVRYLYREYILVAVNKGEGKIYYVKVGNNPFTPYSGNLFQEAPISFMLAESRDTVELGIFNMQGERVRNYKLSGKTRQCTQAWDGKDEKGKLVKGGIYMFQIRAGGDTYTGTILLIK
ncbi:MAG: FlgD immunoglobulin-like domain containing protein, partial [bacterium]|nr:FlgD immunoglobulin-like domain containing protein [bacterium]